MLVVHGRRGRPPKYDDGEMFYPKSRNINPLIISKKISTAEQLLAECIRFQFPSTKHNQHD